MAANPVTNKIYVANYSSNTVTVIDGATNDTTSLPAGACPCAVAVNPITNKIYAANQSSHNVTVIDGATNATTTVPAGLYPYAVAVNPVTNKIYVVNDGSNDVTVIDGTTNATTMVPAGPGAYAVAVNPVTNRAYVADYNSNSVTVIEDAPNEDTKVHAAFDRLPGDTTVLARPPLTGRGVNRWTPGHTAMMGVLNRVGTTQMPWDWANVTGGSGTDSITWSYEWGTDSLLMGENFVCCVPLEDQAATTNNLGFGTPFVGNIEVYPVYRLEYTGGVEETSRPAVRVTKLPTIVRGVLVLGAVDSRQNTGYRAELLDISGRKVQGLHPGANDVGHISPGVYFVRSELSAVSREPSAVTKVIISK